jgi:glycerol-3-phosphate acyltransferase PlsY
MDIILMFQYLGGGLGMLSVGIMSLLPRYIIHSMVLHAISCVAMAGYAVHTDQPGIYISQLTYLVFDLAGVVMWSRHHRTIEKGLNKTIDKVKKEM